MITGGDSIGALVYQYGRSVPFAATLGARLDTVNTQKNFAWAVKNPVRYFGIASNWTTQDNSTAYLWNDKNVARDADGKSIFDPSPIGWRVPVRYTLADVVGSSTCDYATTDEIGGTYKAGTVNAYFPSVGYRDRASSLLTGSSNYSFGMWLATPNSTTYGYQIYATSTATSYQSQYSRTQGNAIRPIREN